MSEYVTIESESTDDPNIIELYINQTLTNETEEVYPSSTEGDVGSPIAQMLFQGVDGIQALHITEDCLIITRAPDTPWEVIIDEIRDALRDFFL